MIHKSKQQINRKAMDSILKSDLVQGWVIPLLPLFSSNTKTKESSIKAKCSRLVNVVGKEKKPVSEILATYNQTIEKSMHGSSTA